MTASELKKTMMINNPALLERRVGSETLVVTGASRGMTSVVSLTLFELGYFIGDTLQTNNYEDVDMRKAMRKSAGWACPSLRRRRRLTSLISARNERHVRWGFKIPDAIDFLPELATLLRAPVFVLCIRNPVATCRSVMTRNPNVSGGLATAYRNARKSISAMDYLMDSTTVPSMVIDMDSVQRHPEIFLEEFSNALALNGDHAGILPKISETGYKRATARPGISFVTAQGDLIDEECR